MIQLRLLLIILLLFSSSYPVLASAKADNLPEIIKKIEPSILVINTYDRDGNSLNQGSGFFIGDNGDIITNRHVLRGAMYAEVKTMDNKIFPVSKVLAEDREGDLIRLAIEVPKEEVRPLTVSLTLPEVGERVLVIGSPLGLEQTVSDGIVSAVREVPTFGKIVQISAPISSGSSGSPVTNLKGEVIGVATFQMIEGQNLNFAIPSSRVAQLTASLDQTLTEWGAEKVKVPESNAKRHYSKGISLMWSKDYKKALASFETAVKEDPKLAEAYFQVGYCLDELGQHLEAIKAYKKAIKLKPDFGEAYYNLGITYDKLQHYQEAIEAYKQAVKYKEEFAEAFYNLGIAYGMADQPGEAIEAFKGAIRINPDDADSHLNLGIAYGKVGRKEEGIEALKQAIRINPDDSQAHYSLGIMYLRIDSPGAALREYKILKHLDPDLAEKLFALIYK